MASKILYHGDCANPPHREFLDTLLTPVVREVLGRDSVEVDVVFVRPEQVHMNDSQFDEFVQGAVQSLYRDISVIRKGEYDDAVHDGYVVTLVDAEVGATWIYIARKAILTGHWTVRSGINRLCLQVLSDQLRVIVRGFPNNAVTAGAV